MYTLFLIIVISTSGINVQQIEFDSQAECTSSLTDIKNSANRDSKHPWQYVAIKGFCLKTSVKSVMAQINV